jgi:polysaccharide chain length determinant protein (PEP-CTERM system associated)
MSEEIFDDQQQEKLDWAKYWAVARRRCWLFVLPFFVGWAVVWSVSWLLPSVYRSSTLILVQHQSNSLVVGSNGQELQSRMDSISQQVLSRTNLLRIATTLNLYADQRSSGKLTDDELVDRMRKNIEIEVAQTSGDRVPSSFNIYFRSPSPDIAQQVTTELTSALISGTIENTQSELERQNKFLDREMAEVRSKLTDQEEKVRVYKDRHIGELPGQLQSNIQILSGKQSQLQGEQDALSAARQRREYLETLLSQYTSATATTKSGEVPVGLPALDQELDRLRSQLANLSSIYTDQHPDVRKLKEQIAKTERMKEQLMAQLKNKPDTAEGNDSTGSTVPTSGPIMEVKSQLKANQLEIASRQHSIESIQAEINSYQARLNNTPVREQELTDLNRDYDQLKAYYDQLLGKKNQAGLATNFSREQQGDRFTMQDPPSRPTKPYSPNRFKLSCMGLFAGLVVGLVAAGGAEFLDDRIYDEDAFKQLVPAEVLVEIPALHTPLEEQEQKRWQKLSLFAIGAIGMIVLLGTAISFLRG